MQKTAHDWFKPRLAALVAEAEAAGYARDISVAVITDLVNGTLSPLAPIATDETWDHDIGEPDSAVHGAPSPEAGGPSYGGDIANPLDHLGRHRRL